MKKGLKISVLVLLCLCVFTGIINASNKVCCNHHEHGWGTQLLNLAKEDFLVKAEKTNMNVWVHNDFLVKTVKTNMNVLVHNDFELMYICPYWLGDHRWIKGTIGWEHNLMYEHVHDSGVRDWVCKVFMVTEYYCACGANQYENGSYYTHCH